MWNFLTDTPFGNTSGENLIELTLPTIGLSFRDCWVENFIDDHCKKSTAIETFHWKFYSIGENSFGEAKSR